ncbi:hypothetical protein DV737_g4621, partial [Chaetothyriales sp. CBS 132003]
LLGQPVSADVDVGLAVHNGDDVPCHIFSGTSILNPGTIADRTRTESIGTLLSPLSQSEIGTIRCIGLNYRAHADEGGFAHPTVPPVFFKPAHSLTGPGEVVIPKLSQVDDCADFEAELGVVLGKEAKNVKAADALDYVLGYTACNDVSSRTSQLQGGGGQWSFSKSFDGACPTGPVVVHRDQVSDPAVLKLTGQLNGKVMQSSGVDDLIFPVPQLIEYLSQSQTLPAGTLIVTGTPAGVGFTRKPKVSLRDGDVFTVEVTGGVGTLINRFVNEK